MVVSTPLLLVEDNLADAYLLIEMLEQVEEQPWQITQAKRLSIALEYLRHSNFLVVLLDLTLPDSKGLNTVTRIQDSSATAMKMTRHRNRQALAQLSDGNSSAMRPWTL